MELPQQRPFATEGRKATHDFLSLYSHPTAVQQDPRPPSQGGFLKTHDFLQPLERVGKTVPAKGETNVEISTVEKQPPPPAPPPQSVEHILPGGIGTYSISHIPYFNQRVPKPEVGAVFTVAQSSSTDKNDDNSNCSSYPGGGFTLWEESALKKGKTGKENVGERSNVVRDAAVKAGQWAMSERPSQSSSNNNHRNSFSSLSSSQPSGGQKGQSFMEMIKSAKASSQDEDLDDEEEFVLKKESPSPSRTGELRVKVDGQSSDQKPNTPRSKHSATEQRRRSKINDRFLMLREIIPHTDQKRDKASFLLEVIEYIQFLQEKVQKYEGSYPGWSHEPVKLVPWRNNNQPADSYADQSRALNGVTGPALMFGSKLDEKNAGFSSSIPRSSQNPAESDMSSATAFKAMEHHPGITNKTMPFPMSVQPNIFSPSITQLQPRLTSDGEKLGSQSQSQSCHTSCSTDGAIASDKMKEQDLAVEGGTISISSAYSQGLLNTLTQALQSSGVDLSLASISVQIELGKRTNSRPSASTSLVKENDIPSRDRGTVRSRVSSVEESDQAVKKLKMSKS